jgi:hypothetical protein
MYDVAQIQTHQGIFTTQLAGVAATISNLQGINNSKNFTAVITDQHFIARLYAL